MLTIIIGVIIVLTIAGLWLRGIFIMAWIGLKFLWDVITFPIALIYKIVKFFTRRKKEQKQEA
ncbi:hypothetical protein GK047_27835 [Paenibacillus sp. SYP-B3998]|uniref:Uncharacterized protein n=1 Tax=Paenibacillus sp. SYP-B3998 TaxID=2678564 RepID=A0A6G4A7Y9_9BACL|nr:hypothetical protein [Paenibacillus sp. SYP-B3998]NEW09737.1 hypothetical protein [Paenibacillus sp. SYP-B3998]